MEYSDQQQRMEAGFNHIRQELENVDTDPPSYPFPSQDAENYNWPKNQLSPPFLCKKAKKTSVDHSAHFQEIFVWINPFSEKWNFATR